MHAAYRRDRSNPIWWYLLSAIQAETIALIVLIRCFLRLLGFDSAIPECGGDGFQFIIGRSIYRIWTALGFKIFHGQVL